MTKLFGANWKTTVMGGLQSLFSAFVTGALTFPRDWHDPKQDVLFGLVVLATFFGISFAVQAKQRNVTGGNVQQTVNGSTAEPGTQSLVDETVIASIKSGETVPVEQRNAVAPLLKAPTTVTRNTPL